MLDVQAIRQHFPSIMKGRIVTNNAASTQPPHELAELFRELAPDYENVHRGQSTASREMTEQFEHAFDTIAQFINAPSRRNIALYRNTTEAHNSVMYALLTEFRDGDNVVTTMMEHNSNFVPWYAMCKDILPKFGINVSYRIVNFDPETGELDLEHLSQLVDERTKIVSCTGASNFFGTKNPLTKIREITRLSGYEQPNGMHGSYLLIDGAQLVPSTFVDVQELDVDYLSFSFHKLLAPFGMGVLYGREELLKSSLPFLYGGDMIAQGEVSPTRVGYGDLPWKYSAGTPNVMGAIVSGEAIRVLLDLVLHPGSTEYFRTGKPIERETVKKVMDEVTSYMKDLTEHALNRIGALPGVTIYGPKDAKRRTSLVSFNVEDRSPHGLAEALNDVGVESRAGCHCADLAHHCLLIPASCRLSFYFYNTIEEVDHACDALERIVREEIYSTNGALKPALATA